MASPRHVRGVSLIEVLMAVLVFSVGLIGLSGLLIMSFRSNQSGYQRTQAEFLAMAMADRMRANPLAVWSGAYNSTGYPTSTKQNCTTAAACTPTQLAVRDQYQWSTQLTTFLPNAKATITCTNGATPTAAQLAVRPPYAGNCVMQITWTERALGDISQTQANSAAARTYVWNFQP